MADDPTTTGQTPDPAASPDPAAANVDPSVPPEASTPAAAVTPDPTSTSPSTSPDSPAAPSGDPEQLASDFKKPELQAAAAVLGADVPSSATKADLAEAIVSQQTPAAAPVEVNNYTQRSGADALFGSWVDVIAGEHAGRYGAYVATVEYDEATGYPQVIIIRTRDADNLLLEVQYQDVRPSERNGGR